MSYELRYVAPQEIHRWWDLVSPDLEECRAQDPDDIWLEDIYHLIRSSLASLHVALVDGEYAGCCLLNVNTDPYSGAKRLNIWYANCHEGPHIVANSVDEIEKMARAMGAIAVTWTANRHSFERWGKKLGFRLNEVRMIKEL